MRRAKVFSGYAVAIEPHPQPGERDRVLVDMPLEVARERLSPLSTCNESCMTFNAAFLILFALALLALPVVWVLGRLRLQS